MHNNLAIKNIQEELTINKLQKMKLSESMTQCEYDLLAWNELEVEVHASFVLPNLDLMEVVIRKNHYEDPAHKRRL